jgi:hypothetical protein
MQQALTQRARLLLSNEGRSGSLPGMGMNNNAGGPGTGLNGRTGGPDGSSILNNAASARGTGTGGPAGAAAQGAGGGAKDARGKKRSHPWSMKYHVRPPVDVEPGPLPKAARAGFRIGGEMFQGYRRPQSKWHVNPDLPVPERPEPTEILRGSILKTHWAHSADTGWWHNFHENTWYHDSWPNSHPWVP